MRRRHRFAGWAATAFLGVALTGCAGFSYAVHGSPKSPELDATIVGEVKKEMTISTLKITADHLAPPDRLASGGSYYVVWARGGDSDNWLRVGSLKYDEGSRKGSLEGASVPLTSFDLSVTVEKRVTPASPSSDILMSQRVK
jgi:hypothetical protein